MKTNQKAAKDIPLIPFRHLEANVKKALRTTKAQSDKQIAEMQDSNVKRRTEKKMAGGV